MRKRETILIQMEILASLFASPKGPTRLAQACNIQYARLQNFTGPLLAKGLVESVTVDGEQRFSITDAGYKLYKDWLEIWRRLPLA
ncbi:MAG TPA: winged helix-turn-helix domain-containing protein [Nitrososphaerales archaeon]|nr:winged helix-turn-helix domain-containing protein [Nitrososphaerales archaeon]